MIKMRAIRLSHLGALALASGLCLATGPGAAPAFAQVLGSTPYVPKPDPAVERMQTRLDAMEADLRRATGRFEQLSYDLTQARRAAEEANAGRMSAEKAIAALTLRLEALEGIGGDGSSTGAGAATGPAEAGVNLSRPSSDAGLQSRIDLAQLPADEAGHLKEARNLLLAGDYPSAEAAFDVYLQRHGKSENAGEAQYLLGESMLYQEAYPEAAEAYVKLLSTYKNSPRAPEGLVKLARSMRLMGEKAEACKALSQMSSRFPKASEAAKTLAATEKSRAGC
ncbi:MAG: tol-pal system protein YbgF [Alphaproteobacteria bacterium]|nr:tol-pal system protein YbgF [Alphaproteobacteria bacterium]